MNSIGNILVVNKPVGPTSHDVVAQARRLFKTRSVGHAGTLDPMASGVLLLLIGEATKLSSALTLDHKMYRATIRFGMSTDSYDAVGVPTEQCVVPPGWLERDRLEQALEAERQRTLQVPPAVSAIKQNGKPAYDRHRRGEQVLLAERAVGVLEMQLISFSDASVELSLAVTKGYYVRSLARDIGEALGMPSHLAALCRTRSGCFTLNEAANWPCAVAPPCLSIADVARRCMLTRVVNAEGARRAQCGLLLHAEHWNEASGVCNPGHSSGVEMWLDESDNPVALGEPAEDGSWKVVRGFRPRVEAQ